MATKKVGRPKGSKNIKPTTEVIITNDFEARINRLNADIRRLQAEIDNLHHQAVGYDAVISYLEHKLFCE
jgi:uncharacterized small protein (DUF1192 family)